MTKCDGTLIFTLRKQLALSVSNSLLSTFIRTECNLNLMDSQEIEEFLLTKGPLTLQYTSENQITSLSKVNETDQQQKTDEDSDSNEELCAEATDHSPVPPPSGPQFIKNSRVHKDHKNKKEHQTVQH